jgi:cytochrome c oxidase cbb3-type subunit I
MAVSERTVETSAPAATVASTPAAPTTFTPAEIDLSARALLLFFAAGSLWLVLGTFLSAWGAVGLHVPGASFGISAFTVGRVRPAAMNALIYGFAIQIALAVLIWIICRLGRIPLIGSRTTIIAGVIWNFGVLLGVLGILGGASSGFEWLEMPRYAPPLLLVAFGVIGIAVLVTFHFRRDPDLYVSHWFLIGGLFWFIWIYSAATLMLLYFPVRGAMQGVVSAWYGNNLYYLFFVPVCLGTAFYFIPKLLGTPLRTRNLAGFSFWTLGLFGAWSGLTLLIGGPIPAWMLSASIFANVLLLVPVFGLASVIRRTAAADKSRLVEPVVYRFIRFGSGCFIVASLLNILLGLPIVSRVTHLTLVEAARNLLALYGFVAMVLFGAVYYILPRVANVAWPSLKLQNWHYLASVLGMSIAVVALAVGGVIQGFRMNLGTTDMVSITRGAVPFIGMSLIGLLILLAGQVAFASNIFRLLHVWGGPFRGTIRALCCPPAGKERP